MADRGYKVRIFVKIDNFNILFTICILRIYIMFVRKKMEDDRWDFMISYEWKTGLKYADKLFAKLKKDGYKVLLDRNEMKGNIYKEMAKAVFKSEVIILLISEAYEKSVNCKLEYNYAIQKRKLIIPAKVEKYNPVEGSELDLLIAGKL